MPSVPASTTSSPQATFLLLIVSGGWIYLSIYAGQQGVYDDMLASMRPGAAKLTTCYLKPGANAVFANICAGQTDEAGCATVKETCVWGIKPE